MSNTEVWFKCAYFGSACLTDCGLRRYLENPASSNDIVNAIGSLDECPDFNKLTVEFAPKIEKAFEDVLGREDPFDYLKRNPEDDATPPSDK